jgi:prefoldin subunit 5
MKLENKKLKDLKVDYAKSTGFMYERGIKEGIANLKEQIQKLVEAKIKKHKKMIEELDKKAEKLSDRIWRIHDKSMERSHSDYTKRERETVCVYASRILEIKKQMTKLEGKIEAWEEMI